MPVCVTPLMTRSNIALTRQTLSLLIVHFVLKLSPHLLRLLAKWDVLIIGSHILSSLLTSLLRECLLLVLVKITH
jgi:hypothetical protein